MNPTPMIPLTNTIETNYIPAILSPSNRVLALSISFFKSTSTIRNWMSHCFYQFVRFYHLYIINIYIYILVGGIPTPLKNMSSSVGMIIPNIWKKMFQTTNQYIFSPFLEDPLHRACAVNVLTCLVMRPFWYLGRSKESTFNKSAILIFRF